MHALGRTHPVQLQHLVSLAEPCIDQCETKKVLVEIYIISCLKSLEPDDGKCFDRASPECVPNIVGCILSYVHVIQQSVCSEGSHVKRNYFFLVLLPFVTGIKLLVDCHCSCTNFCACLFKVIVSINKCFKEHQNPGR